MTAAAVRIPDIATVIQRADLRFTKRSGDDPGTPEYRAAITLAVQQQVVDVLLAASGNVEPIDVKQLRADNSELADQLGTEQRRADAADARVTELTEQLADAAVRPGSDGLLAEVERLKGELAEARKDVIRRVDRAVGATKASTNALNERVGELKIEVANKAGELDKLRSELKAARDANTELEAAVAERRKHVHHYPVDTPADEMPAACVCGKEYPPSVLLEPGVEEPPEPRPWDGFFGLREQLVGWPEAA